MDYKVFLKQNNYFKEPFLGKDNKYIANLIDYIDANFMYDLNFKDTNLNFNYSYRIVAYLKVTDKDDSVTLYDYSEELYNSGTLKSVDNVKIAKRIDIDYNKYNSLINSFVDDFDLDRASSNLKVSMLITLLDGNEYINELNDEKVISLNIPLTTKTVSISMNSDLQNSVDNKILIHKKSTNKELIIISIINTLLAIIYFLIVIISYLKNRTPQAIYRKKLKSILSNYDSYIQCMNNDYKIGAKQVIKINSFNDMLEIRDTLKTPILMIQNSKKTGAFFIIMAPHNEVIFTYALRVIDFIAKKEGIEAPAYDIKNIDKVSNIEKKYTKEYIDDQITRTISLESIDGENAIMGNKDRDEDIYSQLEKTTNYQVKSKRSSTKKTNRGTKKKY